MPEQRHVYRVGKSLVVALPATVREHLGIERGEAVYWHLIRGKEAILTRRPVRLGGKPEGLALQRELASARAEVERLRRRLSTRPLRVLHEGQSLGWSQAMEASTLVGDVLTEIRARLDSIEARMPYRARRRSRAVERVHAPILGPDDKPPPDLPPLPPSGGDAARGAASPQAAHS